MVRGEGFEPSRLYLIVQPFNGLTSEQFRHPRINGVSPRDQTVHVRV